MKYLDYIYGTKFFGAFILAFPVTAVMAFFETYIYNDWKVITSIAIFVMMDTGLGLYKAVKYKNLSSLQFSQFFEKVIAYFCLLVISHHIGDYSANQIAEPVLNTIAGSLGLGILIREAISIVENIEIIRPGTVPKFFTDKLNLFNEKGSFDNSNNRDSE